MECSCGKEIKKTWLNHLGGQLAPGFSDQVSVPSYLGSCGDGCDPVMVGQSPDNFIRPGVKVRDLLTKQLKDATPIIYSLAINPSGITDRPISEYPDFF